MSSLWSAPTQPAQRQQQQQVPLHVDVQAALNVPMHRTAN